MKIALLGYGKMGKLLDELAPSLGVEVVQRLDIWNNEGGAGITEDNFRGVEVALDFSIPQAVLENLPRVAALGVNLVVGTTGWHDELDQVRATVEERGIGMVYSSNYSIGVNIFYRVVETATRWLRERREYDPWIYEIHHRAKLGRAVGHGAEAARPAGGRVRSAFHLCLQRPRRRHPGRAHRGLRFRGRHHHPDAHRSQPEGLCPGGAAGR